MKDCYDNDATSQISEALASCEVERREDVIVALAVSDLPTARLVTPPPVATLLGNETTKRTDAATFRPPLGPARVALKLCDKWNDVMYAAEMEHGDALLIWGTGA